MRSQRQARNRGLTLVETIITLAIFLVVLLALYSVFDSSNAVYQSGRRKSNVQQDARTAMEEMSTRIRMTGFFWENFFGAGGVTTPVPLATNTQLAVHGTFDNPVPPASPQSNVYFFCRLAEDPPTLRMRLGPVGQASTYVCDTNAEVLARNVIDLRFAYVLGDGTVTIAPTAAQRDAIQAIRVMILARARVDNAGDPPQVITLSSTIALRNFVMTP
jgi:prepilin-type N-terminal cleavage/methylation domain-containing protein